jgi:hypothetical protein
MAGKPSMPMIMLPADIEKCCRRSIKEHDHHSVLAIRVAIAASVLHGNEWFGLHDVQTGLHGTSQRASIMPVVAERLEKFGVIERRTGPRSQRLRHEARLLCSLVDVSTFHGSHSERLGRALETYCQNRKRATPLVALLWLAVNLYKLNLSVDVVSFLKPDFDLGTSATSPGRIFSKMSDAGLVTIVRQGSVPSQPFVILPTA